MFPIDSATGTYYADMVEKFDGLTGGRYPLEAPGYSAGGADGRRGCGFADGRGRRPAGCLRKAAGGNPPVPAGRRCGHRHGGHQQRGAANRKCIGGNSIFAMLVLDRELRSTRPEVELVVGPDRSQVAMAHCNNCTSDLNAWMDYLKRLPKPWGLLWIREICL